MAGGEKLRIVVCGYIGLFPAGGAVWDYAQYVLGFAELGHDVYYIEDTGNWPTYVPDGEAATGKYNIGFLRAAMEGLGLGERWAYRDPVSERWYGLEGAAVRAVLTSADIFVSISCSAALRDEWLNAPARIVIDSDPMFTQIQIEEDRGFTKGSCGLRAKLAEFTHHYTFGENIGAADCRVPESGIRWIPTRQPIALAHWNSDAPPSGGAFTTIMNWSALPPIAFAGEQWGQKDVEFGNIAEIPRDFPQLDFALVVNGQAKPGFPGDRIAAAGWALLDPANTVPDGVSYRDFIRASAGEISVAKQAYVKARTGWFSCRTACYLAAGRPALVQETGWSRSIPEGYGLQSFAGHDDAVEKLRFIASDLPRHARGARAIAAESFDARKVLAKLIEECRVTV